MSDWTVEAQRRLAGGEATPLIDNEQVVVSQDGYPDIVIERTYGAWYATEDASRDDLNAAGPLATVLDRVRDYLAARP